jgi:hypothetical protein
MIGWGRSASFVFAGVYFLHVLVISVMNLVHQAAPAHAGYQYGCVMNLSGPVSSSRRDVIMFYASHFKPGLVVTLASLVSTGTKCRIVLFVPRSFQPDTRFRSVVSKYKIELMENCSATRGRRLVGHMLRYEYERAWLDKHLHEIDRVIHSDSYDVFFQGDPFQETVVPRDRLVLVKEELLILGCDWNSNWLKACYGNDTWHIIKENPVICTGFMSGNAAEYLRLIKFMMDRPDWDRCWDNSKDQPIFNYLHWMGILAAQEFTFEYTDCFHGVYTMHWCLQDRPIKFNYKGLFITQRGAAHTPPVQQVSEGHQYPRRQV